MIRNSEETYLDVEPLPIRVEQILPLPRDLRQSPGKPSESERPKSSADGQLHPALLRYMVSSGRIDGISEADGVSRYEVLMIVLNMSKSK